MLERMNAHRAWANRSYAGWLAALPDPDAYVLKMWSHVLRAEEAWLVRLRGGVPENKVWTVSPPDELDALRAANDAGFAEVLAGGPESLSRVLDYVRFDGSAVQSTVADILVHACTHGMYHRGQIAAHAARANLPKVPSSDYIAFAREFP